MATRTPTAAQMAARKTFSEMAKAGAFKKRKQNPAKKTRSAPVKRLGQNICSWVDDGYPFKQAVAIALKSAEEKFTPRQVTAAEKSARECLNYPDPLRVTKKGVVRRNPSTPAHRPPSEYAVHRALAAGEQGARLGRFPTLAAAKEYAQAYATAHKCSVGIVGKK